MNEDSHKDFMLSALRAASLRAKMIEMDLNTVGVALKSDMVTPMEAVEWLRQIGALDFVGKIPAAIEVGATLVPPIGWKPLGKEQ